MLGGRCFREVSIPDDILAAILAEPGRKGAHELDKCVALIDMLGSALAGEPRAYPYLDAARDTMAASLVETVGFALS
jgi:hypothetical protein